MAMITTPHEYGIMTPSFADFSRTTEFPGQGRNDLAISSETHEVFKPEITRKLAM